MSDDSTAPFVPGSETSEAAAALIAGDTEALRRIVLDDLRRRGPASAWELADRLGILENTVRPRLCELREKGLAFPGEGKAQRGGAGASSKRWEAGKAPAGQKASPRAGKPQRRRELLLATLLFLPAEHTIGCAVNAVSSDAGCTCGAKLRAAIRAELGVKNDRVGEQ